MYVAAVLTIGDSDYAVAATIPHMEETLTFTESEIEVFSPDNTNFVYDTNTSYTNKGYYRIYKYTGNAKKLVFPSTGSDNVAYDILWGQTGQGSARQVPPNKDNVVAVMIEDGGARNNDFRLFENAFKGWANLRALSLPSGNVCGSVSTNAVASNPQLKFLRLPTAFVATNGYGANTINPGAFQLNPVLENARANDGLMPGAYYNTNNSGGYIFKGSNIRDFYLPESVYGRYIYVYAAGVSGSNTPETYAANFNNSMSYADKGLNAVIMTGADQQKASFSRAITLAMEEVDNQKALSLDGAAGDADAVLAAVKGAYESKATAAGNAVTATWTAPYACGTDYVTGEITLTCDGVSAVVSLAYGSVAGSTVEYAPIREAMDAYVAGAGNTATKAGLLMAVQKALGDDYTVTVADYFVKHAVDGVEDNDTVHPLVIKGNDGYVAASFMVDGTSIGHVSAIPHTVEQLTFAESEIEVFSTDNTNFVYDTNATYTGRGYYRIYKYTGNAKKLVFPSTGSDKVAYDILWGQTGQGAARQVPPNKDNVVAVMIEDGGSRNNDFRLFDNAFNGWANLRALSLPSGNVCGPVNTNAVVNNPKLKYLRLPNSFVSTNGGSANTTYPIAAGAFMMNPVLENARSNDGLMPGGAYNSNGSGGYIFKGTAIRDFYLPQSVYGRYIYVYAAGESGSNTPGAYAANFNNEMTHRMDSVIMPYDAWSAPTLAGAAVYAQQAVDALADSSTVAQFETAINGAILNGAAVSVAQPNEAGEIIATLTKDGKSISLVCNGETPRVAPALQMLDGASVRYTLGTTGMRFTAKVYGMDSMEANEDVQSVKLGMLICPADYIEDDFTKEALNAAGKTYLDVVRQVWAPAGTEKLADKMNMVISNIKEANYTRDFAARAYATITYTDGSSQTVYSAFDPEQNVRNVREVAQAALDDKTQVYTTEQAAVLRGYVGAPETFYDEEQRVALSGMVDHQTGYTDDITNSIRHDIIASPNPESYTGYNNAEYTGATYYVDATEGSDNNDGTTPETAWKTINKVNSASLAAGSKVLFQRGETFRGYIQAKAGVYYGAYGEGVKPNIYGSDKNYADTSLWVEESAGIWKTTVSYLNGIRSKDVGVVVFNNGVAAGNKQFSKNDLSAEGDFFYANDTVYVKMSQNPAIKYADSIELGVHGWLVSIEGNDDNVTIENLTFKYCGGYGVNVGGGVGVDADDIVENTVIKNCEFGFIGGTYADGVRKGNGIEFWQGCHGAVVDNCWFYQIYDSAITHQGPITDGEVYTAQDLTFSNNVIEYCGMYGIEYWLSNGTDANGAPNQLLNITYTGNVIRFSGYGHGGANAMSGNGGKRGLSGIAIGSPLSDALQVMDDNFVISNNIVDTARYCIFHMITTKWEANLNLPRMMNNTLIQRKGETYSWGAYATNQGSVTYYAADETGTESATARLNGGPGSGNTLILR